MFKKCLKYDAKSIWSIWWIVALSVAVIGMVGCVSFRILLESSLSKDILIDGPIGVILRVLLVLTFALAAIAVAAFIALTPILVFIRFYKHFFTDEGYLTFTLPVSRRTLYLSKTVNAMIWMAASGAVVLLIVLFGMLVIPPTGGNTDIPGVFMPDHHIVGPFNFVAFDAIGSAMAFIWGIIGGWSIVYGLELLLGVVLFVLFQVGVTQMCITIGSVIAKRHKLIASIGIYYGINSAISTVGSILFTVSEFTIRPGLDFILRDDMPMAQGLSAIAVFGLVLLVIGAILCSLIHFIALGNVERRLNLA